MKASMLLAMVLAGLGATALPGLAVAGVLSDLVVARADQAEAVAKASVPSKAFGGIDLGEDRGVHPSMTGRRKPYWMSFAK